MLHTAHRAVIFAIAQFSCYYIVMIIILSLYHTLNPNTQLSYMIISDVWSLDLLNFH